jgi:transposase
LFPNKFHGLKKETAMKKRAQKLSLVNNNVLVAGVDIGKFRSVARFIAPDGRESKPFSIRTGRSGFDCFAAWLAAAVVRHGCDGLVVGMEPTGHYWEPLARYLDTRGTTVVLVNPHHTRRAKELDDNSPVKTDAKDALVIADLVRQGKYLKMRLPGGVYAELRTLAVARDGMVVELTAKVNRLRRLVDSLFPEFFDVLKKPTGATALHLLELYPSPKAVLGLGEVELAKILRSQSRGRMGLSHAMRLVEAARNTVGATEAGDALALQIKWAVKDISSLLGRIREAEGFQRVALERVPYAGYLLSLKGVGVVTAAGILGETGDIKDFRSIPEFLKLAGLNLCEQSSGKREGARRITKRGRPLLRKLLYQLALRLVKSGGALSGYYQGLRRRGIAAPKALVAVSRKAAGILFALVRDGRHFVKERVSGHPAQEAETAVAA